MKQVLACIDGSAASVPVCDYAAWASTRLAAPLVFLHVIDQPPVVHHNLSGTLGANSRQVLMDELVALDERRTRLAREHGEYLLDAAKHHVDNQGVVHPIGRQRHGNLIDSILDAEADTGLIVLGRSDIHSSQYRVGRQVESVTRAVDCSVMVASSPFTIPQRFVLAYDGSETAQRCVEKVAVSTLLKGLDCHLLMVGGQTTSSRAQMSRAQRRLEQEGYAVTAAIHGGEFEAVIANYCRAEQIDLLVMGAFGSSRLHRFFVGSTTTTMLHKAPVPLLLLR
ncbi:universal stress protein [Stutzerimonas kunmingensis]|uniref:universal stress protein n=1 Tax=Stutzerimonas kunmingensis TaxID=1211807 RepID=UPI0005B50676|nr:universal stress protein [Stutzerimonas kunmingensis]